MKQELRKKTLLSLTVSSLFGLTLFFFGPTHIYFTNILEHSSSFSEIVFVFLGLSALCALALTALLVLLRLSIFERAVSLLLCLSFLLWLQGNIMVWNYGALDGRRIDWNVNTIHGLLDSGIWLAGLTFAFLAAPHIYKRAQRAGVALLLIQLVATLVIVVKAPDASRLHEKSVTTKQPVFEFSPEKNVLILVLDSFQGDFFNEVINEDPSYKDLFEGFVYYRNALGGYPVTYATLALILSGRYYENSVPIQDFIKETFSSGSLPKILKGSGYQVDLINCGKHIYADKNIASNWPSFRQLTEQNTKLEEAAFLLDTALFRYSPHYLKRYVYNNQVWLFSNLPLGSAGQGFPPGYHRNSVSFVTKMSQEARASNERYSFKYIHLNVSHLPIRINENLEYEEHSVFSRENYKKQAKGSLRLVHMLLDTMKRLGIYDNTMVFILADHGLGEKVEMGETGHVESGIGAAPMIDSVKGHALTLFLVKQFAATGDMQISDAPVSLADVAKTIASELDLSADIPGVSIYDVGNSDDRSRRFLYYAWNRSDILRKYDPFFPPISEYAVSGLSWMDESWRLTNRILAPGGTEYASPISYQYGASIDFGFDGDSQRYIGKGWSLGGPAATWTDGKSASLIIPIAKIESNIELRAVFSPYTVWGKLEEQRVTVLVNGNIVGKWTAQRQDNIGERILRRFKHEREFVEKTAVIPRELLEDSEVLITFDLPDATSPASLGVSQDARALGIEMRSLVLRPILDSNMRESAEKEL